MIIRILLLTGLAAIGWFVFLRRNKMPFHIVTVFALIGLGTVAVLVPDATSEIAQLVGVGRGADLIMYISIVSIFFVLVHYYSKFTEMQRNMTQLVRELAILRAEQPLEQPSSAKVETPRATPASVAVEAASQAAASDPS